MSDKTQQIVVRNVRRLVALPTTYVCYWLGDACSRLLNTGWFERGEVIGPLLAEWYQHVMRQSLRADMWGECGTWGGPR